MACLLDPLVSTVKLWRSDLARDSQPVECEHDNKNPRVDQNGVPTPVVERPQPAVPQEDLGNLPKACRAVFSRRRLCCTVQGPGGLRHLPVLAGIGPW